MKDPQAYLGLEDVREIRARAERTENPETTFAEQLMFHAWAKLELEAAEISEYEAMWMLVG